MSILEGGSAASQRMSASPPYISIQFWKFLSYIYYHNSYTITHLEISKMATYGNKAEHIRILVPWQFRDGSVTLLRGLRLTDWGQYIVGDRLIWIADVRSSYQLLFNVNILNNRAFRRSYRGWQLSLAVASKSARTFLLRRLLGSSSSLKGAFQVR